MRPRDTNLIRTGQLLLECELHPHTPQALRGNVENLWERGLPPGDKAGWPSVDILVSFVTGLLCLVTGWPGSGKSELLDAILLRLAPKGWRFVMFSPENHPVELHVAKLIEKFLGKPFGAGLTQRATKEEVNEALGEIEEWFSFLLPSRLTERETFSVDDILAAAEVHFRMIGAWGDPELKRGLVIDPWNEVEHSRPVNLTETEYISLTLTRIRAWARKHGVLVFIVAHPQKLRRDDGGKLPVPRPDSVSGSQHWWNKCDVALTVHRYLDQPDKREIDLHVQKVRFKHLGRTGIAQLVYDRITGRYNEPLRAVPAADYQRAKDGE